MAAMSSDEEALIIGRMLLERKELTKQGALLNEELTRIGSQLSILGDTLKRTTPPYIDEPFQLSDADRSILDAAKIVQLLTEASEVTKRFKALQENLGRVGV